MGSERLLRGALCIGGLFTALIGIGHIFMPTLGYDNAVAATMTQDIRDHFYYMGTYAICVFLLSFAFLSLYFSSLRYPYASLVVCSVLAVFWISRAVFELLYPVELRIFFLEQPHNVLMPVTLFIALIYSVSALKGWMVSPVPATEDTKILR